MEIPSARVMRKHSYRIGVGQVDPYRYYYVAISPFQGLELDGRITEVLGVKVTQSGWGGYGNTKDKGSDLKYQLWPEGKYLPAISLGIMDPHGTRIYTSQYVVFSKQIYPFDFTVGLGNGRYGKKSLPAQGEGVKLEMLSDPGGWLSDSQVFWGIQFAPSEKYAFMVEYSPIKYHIQVRDPAHSRYFREPAPSKFNFGLRWRPVRWAELDLTYQRGQELGLNFSMAFNIGRPLIPIYDHPYKEKAEDRVRPVTERIQKALAASGFSDIGVLIVGDDLWVEAQNDKYYYTPRAWRVILNIIHDIPPEPFEYLNIILKENGIPMSFLHLSREDLVELQAGRLKPDEFLYLSQYGAPTAERPAVESRYKRTVRYGLRPSLETFLNDPSGFFRYRLGLSAWTNYHPWRGSSFIAGLAGYPINNVTSSNEPLSIPVRSDVVLYKKRQVALDRLMFDQMERLTSNLYARLAAGLLEVQYAGLDAEVAVPLLNGRIFLGLSGSAVKKRAPSRPFHFKEDEVKDVYTTGFVNARLNIPEKEVAVDVKAGRFLAGDKGARITISKFINGVILWAWYSFTDTSMFSDRFNRGYHDKGIGVTIPMRLFEGKDTKTAYHLSLSPWTRDVAQDIDHYHNLFDFIGRNTNIYLDKDKEMMR